MMDLDRPRYINALSELVGGMGNLIGGLTDGPMSEIKFVDGISKPTESAVQTKLAEMVSEWTAQAYARNRKIEYDALNQFELISDDEANGTTTHKDAIAAIKTKHPKG